MSLTQASLLWPHLSLAYRQAGLSESEEENGV